MHMEEPEEPSLQPSLSLAADRRLIWCGGLELLTGEGRISPSHQHQKCIMNVLQTCPSRAVGAAFDVPLNDFGKSASQKIKHWSTEAVTL